MSARSALALSPSQQANGSATTDCVGTKWSPTHRRFTKYLVESVTPQFVVARWLHFQGFDVSVKGLQIADDAADPVYTDGGDITVSGKGVVDVKHLASVMFRSADDFPYAYATAGFKPSIDKLLPDLYAGIFVSVDCEAAYIVKTSTRRHWFVRDVVDAVTDKTKKSYFIELKYVNFVDLLALPQHLENRIHG